MDTFTAFPHSSLGSFMHVIHASTHIPSLVSEPESSLDINSEGLRFWVLRLSRQPSPLELR
eukprot:6309131-Amphidinium_carterae.1